MSPPNWARHNLKAAQLCIETLRYNPTRREMTNHHRCYLFGANAAAALLVSSSSFSPRSIPFPPRQRRRRLRAPPFARDERMMAMATTKMYGNANGSSDNSSWVLQWRGEGTEGYSNSLRQLEFICAFRAEMKGYLQSQLYQSREINNSDDNDND